MTEPAKPAPVADVKAAEGVAAPPKKAGRGILSSIWRGIFGARGEDYEKKLQNLSKEEASVHARMKRRTLSSRRMSRNVIVVAVAIEVVAVAYAIMTTRSLELNWKMRAVRVLPMFLVPGLSSVIYTTLLRFTRMLDRKDQNTLERLRAERKAKIDELKERTNYYSTQQLIQRYDLDPAAKAAAATVLASKLGADSGLKMYFENESKTDLALAKSNDVEPVQSSGLRNRKQPHARNTISGSSTMSQGISETPGESGPDNQEVAVQGQMVVEHFRGTGANDGGWIARIAALLVGEDPSQSYALICGNCHMHNGLARREDFPYITYYCPHCHALNQSLQSPDQELRSVPAINAGDPSLGGIDHADNVSSSSTGSDNETMAESASARELPQGAK